MMCKACNHNSSVHRLHKWPARGVCHVLTCQCFYLTVTTFKFGTQDDANALTKLLGIEIKVGSGATT